MRREQVKFIPERESINRETDAQFAAKVKLGAEKAEL
jgi:hypothetical protein